MPSTSYRWWEGTGVTKAFVAGVDAEAAHDRAGGAASELRELIQVEAARERGRVEEQLDPVF